MSTDFFTHSSAQDILLDEPEVLDAASQDTEDVLLDEPAVLDAAVQDTEDVLLDEPEVLDAAAQDTEDILLDEPEVLDAAVQDTEDISLDESEVLDAAVQDTEDVSLDEPEILDADAQDTEDVSLDEPEVLDAAAQDTEDVSLDEPEVLDAAAQDTEDVSLDGPEVLDAAVQDTEDVSLDGPEVLDAAVQDAEDVSLDEPEVLDTAAQDTEAVSPDEPEALDADSRGTEEIMPDEPETLGEIPEKTDRSWMEENIHEAIQSAASKEELYALREFLLENSEGIPEAEEDGGGPVRNLKRRWTPELQTQFDKDTSETLDNFRQYLENHQVDPAEIERFLHTARDQIYEEFRDSFEGSVSFGPPNDWNAIARDLGQKGMEQQGDSQGLPEGTDAAAPFSLKELYTQVASQPVEAAFSNYNIARDPDGLQKISDNFYQKDWAHLALHDKSTCLKQYSTYLAETLGLKEAPALVLDSEDSKEKMGAADMDHNVLHINQEILYDPELAADTISHEMWHLHQRERMQHPETERDYAYIYNEQPSNYHRAEEDYHQYLAQLVEKEARAFAAHCTGALKESYFDGLKKKLGR